MLITSYCPDKWDLMNRGTTDDGLAMCHVRHTKLAAAKRTTVFRLVKRPNGWYNVGRYITLPGKPGGFVPTPEKKGVKLSGSRIDLTLRSLAETGHGNAYV